MRTEANQGEALPRPSEPRWPVALTVGVTLAMLILLPARVRLLPAWVLYPIGAAFLTPLVICARRPTSPEWMRIERVSTFTFVAVAGTGNLVVLSQLILEMTGRAPAMDGLRLLSSSIAVWATNVVTSSLFFWQFDRGGPAGRASVAETAPDWLFAQDQAPPGDVAAGWRPQFIDYLFLGFSTATAFSTTDAVPVTGRAKTCMMAESVISLVTLVVVAARAINVLGS